ncbi:MAG: TonB-dependent receptor, partial [Odoribacter sp.]
IILGVVKDKKGEPIPGVTIRLDSTSVGTATDMDGKFMLQLPFVSGHLIFSSVGYKNKRVAFRAGEPLLVVMEENISALDEVQVVAYGETNRREMTGSISVVKADDIKGIPSPSISNLLQGRVAGMDVTNVSGAPGGGGTQVTIRGYNSLNIESGRRFSNPLWVVDGVPMNSFTSPVTGTNGLADLNPETIESVQVLKDASATSLYGSRAANGVIIVTTKKGRKNQDAQFSANFSYTYSILPEYPVVYGGRGEREYRLKGYRNSSKAFLDYDLNKYRYPTSYEDAWNTNGSYDSFWGNGKVENDGNGNELQDSLNPFYNNSTNFFKYYFHAGKVLNANVQATGGSEAMTYSVGLGYYDEEGISKGSGYNRINLMGNFYLNPIRRLGIDFRTYLAISDRSRGNKTGGMSGGSDVETVPGDPMSLSTLLPGNSVANTRAMQILKMVDEKNNTYRLRSSFGLKLELMRGLDLSSTLSVDYTQNNRNHFVPAAMNKENESLTTGEVAREMMVLNENLLTFKRSFLAKHNVDVMLGYSYQYDQSNYIGGQAIDGPSDLVKYATKKGWGSLKYRDDGKPAALKNYESDFMEKKMASYFGRVNYNYRQKYMMTMTLRRDGSSVFGENVRWATFPSAAVAWNFSEEYFMKRFRFLDFAKLRFSYGVSGNQFTNPYLSYGILNGGGSYDGSPTIEPDWNDGYYNPDLTWEETEQYDFGLDMNMLDYRLSVTFDYYYRYTDQMLYKVLLPGDYSGYTKQWRNAAAVSNEGMELDVKYDIFRGDKLSWNISVNVARNWNMFRKSHNGRDLRADDGTYILGEQLGAIYGLKTDGYLQSDKDVEYFYNAYGELKPVAPDYGLGSFFVPGDVKFVDMNGDKSISSVEDLVYLGSSLPKLYGGIVNEVKWKGFDVNMLLSYSLGRDMIYTAGIESLSTQKPLGPILANVGGSTFWEKEGDQTDYPRLSMDNNNGNWWPILDRYVEKVNYLKLKTLTIGYSCPERWLRKAYVKGVRVFFSGENLCTWTNYSGMDPETVDINTGIDDGKNYPLARKLTFGVTINL